MQPDSGFSTNLPEPLDAQYKALADNFSGSIGFWAANLDDGEAFGVNAHEEYPTASAIKVAVLISLADCVRTGALRWEETLEFAPDRRVGGSGVLKELRSRLRLSLWDIATLMILQSDNTATNMLIDLLGLDKINNDLLAHGLSRTRLLNRFDPERLAGKPRNFGVSTPQELNSLVTALAQQTILTATLCDEILDLMSRQFWVDQIPRYLPHNPYARDVGDTQSLWIANKTGFMRGVRVDTAYIRGDRLRYILTVMTEGSHDVGFRVDNEGAILVGRLSLAIYNYFASLSR